jgi:hypothetical protein
VVRRNMHGGPWVRTWGAARAVLSPPLGRFPESSKTKKKKLIGASPWKTPTCSDDDGPQISRK